MLEQIRHIFSIKDLRNKIFFVIGLLIICRLLAHIPVPGVDITQLREFFARNEIFGLLNAFTGGTMENFSIVLMGVGPYITASIIMQLLTMVVPSLDALSKEGEFGREKINHYTRLITPPLAIIQSYAMITLIKNQGLIGSWTPFELITILIAVSAGTILLMWLGELISEKGIGNGISLIITLGILADYPVRFARKIALVYGDGVVDFNQLFGLILFLLISILMIVFIIYVTEAERRLPVTYARRVRGMTSYASIESHLPIKVNSAGMIPIIFAMSLMVFPTILARFFTTAHSQFLVNASKWTEKALNPGTALYDILFFLLIVFFTFFYTAVVFKPEQVAENLQKQGGFIAGIRPGLETSQYLSIIIKRVTIAGGVFLGLIAVLPFLTPLVTKDQALYISGAGLLIVVSVIIDTMRQLKAQIAMRRYEYY